eukprot:Opistho-2@22590
MVKLRSLLNDNHWMWSRAKFLNRKFIMQEMYQNYVEGDEWDQPQEKDPFWEPSDMEQLIGSVHVYPQSLCYGIETDETVAITDYKGTDQGQLKVEIVPCKADGSVIGEDDENFVEDPEELIGKPLAFKLRIPYARGLPQKFSKGLCCKYKFYLDETVHSTKEVVGTANPDFAYEKLFVFNAVTEQFLNYLKDQSVLIEVHGRQDDGKPGAPVAAAAGKKPADTRTVVKGTVSVDARYEEERYRLSCEAATMRRRLERLEGKMKRIKAVAAEAAKKKEKTVDLIKLNRAINWTGFRLKAIARIVIQEKKLEKLAKQQRGQTFTHQNISATCSVQ